LPRVWIGILKVINGYVEYYAKLQAGINMKAATHNIWPRWLR